MTVTRLREDHGLFVVEGVIWGPRGLRSPVRMMVDTGAGMTVVIPEILDRIGYSARQAEAITRMRSAVAEEPGYVIRVARLRLLRHEFPGVAIHAHDLPEGFNFDGLLGMDILRRFNFEVRPGEKRMIVDAIASRVGE